MGAMVNSESLANNDSRGVFSIQAVVPKCKRRGVSAVRDYPPGCGRFAAPPVSTSGVESKPQTSDIFTNSSTTGTNELNDAAEVKEAVIEIGHASIDNEPPEAAQVALCESSVISKQVNVDGMASQLGGAVSPITAQKLSLTHVLTVGLEKASARRYPPRGRASAIRDYPPSCGKNASTPDNNKLVELESSHGNTHLCERILPSVGKAIGVMIGDEEKKKEENIKQGESCSNQCVNDKEKHAEETDKSNDVIAEQRRLTHLQKSVKKEAKRSSDKKNHTGKPSKVSAYQRHLQSDFGCRSSASGRSVVQDLISKSEYDSEQREASKNLADGGKEENVLSTLVSEEIDFDGLEVASDRTVVLGVMAQSVCPWRQGKTSRHLDGEPSSKKGKGISFFAQLEKSKCATKTKKAKNHSVSRPWKKTPVSFDDGGDNDNNNNNDLFDDVHIDNCQLAHLPHDVEVSAFPGGGRRTIESENNNSNGSRHRVKESLRLFQALCRKLLHIDEAKSKEEIGRRKRVDLRAYQLIVSSKKCVNKDEKIVGSVPGVEIGDEFQYRVELNMIGLHNQMQGGIDYVKLKGKILATSIVASGGYANDLDNSDVLIYTGQGGNVMNTDKKPEDQKLERGNLALKNSCDEKNPVRVIRGSESVDGKTKVLVYDGLYHVERYWQDMGPHGKLVFKFLLRRNSGQPELAWKELKKSKKLRKREGLILEDISRGKEKIPISVFNTVDDTKPPSFNYITRMIYPNWCNPIPPKGCSCIGGCLDSGSCPCVHKNGGEIPYNHNGAIVESKSLVYECGPTCKCPPSCHNRVTQHGIKFQLEIFKTEKMGWGVRSLNSIPSGSFICEYIGELLDDIEAEKRAGSDEYLFDIGKNYTDNSIWDELSNLMPDESQSSSGQGVVDNGFTIDAARHGNVGRFINHSCTPNLYAQDVLYDHEDSRIPHVMLFAMDNIPPLQELTYHYNYVIDQVRDSRGNIKRKDCYCGSLECTGRMY